jgi:hypothetical protein
MYSEAPTRYSPREKAKVTPNKNSQVEERVEPEKAKAQP